MTDRGPGVDDAYAVMEHVRALRQDLLSGAPEPVGDEERSGLTGPQIAVMTHLATSGPSTVTDLARTLHLSHSTTSGIVDRLQARGFVTRDRDERDRRVTRVSVTGPVTDYVRRLRSGPFGRLARAMAEAPERDRRAVLDGLATLRRLLADPGAAQLSERPDSIENGRW
jgi:MarR family transcriptional regulator, organic hydroperoxide resistance regulator